MEITCDECYDSPNGEYLKSLSDEKHLRVRGTWQKAEAYTVAMAWIGTHAAVVRGRLYPESVTISPIEGTPAWDIRVRYGPKVPLEQLPSEYEFSTVGGTEKISQSLSTVSAVACPNFTWPGKEVPNPNADEEVDEGEEPPPATITRPAIPNFQGGIGYNEDGTFEGCEVKRPRYSWRESHVFPFDFVDVNYRRMLRQMTGAVNLYPFQDFDAHEVIFDGITKGAVVNSDSGGEITRYWKLEFSFEAMPNRYGITVAGSEPFDKSAWDYFWVLRYKKDDQESKRTVSVPAAAYVERVYDYIDFAALMIPDVWGG